MAAENSYAKLAKNALKFLVTILVITLLVRNLGWRAISETIGGADPLRLALGFALFIASGFIGAAQWHLLLTNRGLSITLSRALKLYFTGMFFNNFVMGGFIGDAVRVAAVRSDGGSRKPSFAATALDRFAGLWAMCAFAVAGSVILLNRGMLTGGSVTTAAVALFAAFTLFAGIMLFLMYKPLQSLFFNIIDKIAIFRKFKIREIISEMLIEAGDYKLLAGVSCLSILTQSMRIGVHVLAAASLGMLTFENFQYFFIFVPMIAMIMIVPLPFGVRETAGGALFALAGFPREAAFVMGFLASLIGIAASLAGGVFFITERIGKVDK